MEFKFQKRRGIGTVIATLIILIASVILGAGVIFFGGSMFQTNTQQESIKVSNSHVWVASSANQTGGTLATAAFVVQNTGGKAITINSIALRGISVPTADWYWVNDPTITTATNVQTELLADYSEANVDIGGSAVAMQNPGPVSLTQGQAAIVYLNNPANLQLIDSGLTLTLQVQGGQASAVQSVSAVTE